MPVADTSFLMAVFDEDHPRHNAARARLRKGPLLQVSGGVLGEFTTAVRRTAKDAGLDGGPIARELLGRLEKMRSFRYADRVDPTLVSRLFQENRGISYVDAWCVALALGLRDDLYTFDGRQSTLLRRERRKG